MSTKDELTSALGAHNSWKLKLGKAIESGHLDVPVPTLRASDQCAFGKWLEGGLPAAEKASDHYRTCHRLHAEFHQAAAGVAEQAQRGARREAEQAMAPGSAFAKASAGLTLAVVAWLKTAS